MTGTRKEREAELRELVLAEPRVRAEGDLERAREIHKVAVELRAELMAEDERARTIELIREALNATESRDGLGRLYIVRDELRPIANLGGTEDAALALAGVDELIEDGRAIRRFEAAGEDYNLQAVEAHFATMTEALLDLLNDLEDRCPICGGDHDRISPADCPAYVEEPHASLNTHEDGTLVRMVEVDANDPDAIERLIREAGFEEEMRVRLERVEWTSSVGGFGFDGYYVCSTCYGELRATTGGWEHVDGAEAMDCASARGDDPVGFIFATTELR